MAAAPCWAVQQHAAAGRWVWRACRPAASLPAALASLVWGRPAAPAGGAKRISDEYLLRDAAAMASDSDGSAALARCARPTRRPPARPAARARPVRIPT